MVITSAAAPLGMPTLINQCTSAGPQHGVAHTVSHAIVHHSRDASLSSQRASSSRYFLSSHSRRAPRSHVLAIKPDTERRTGRTHGGQPTQEEAGRSTVPARRGSNSQDPQRRRKSPRRAASGKPHQKSTALMVSATSHPLKSATGRHRSASPPIALHQSADTAVQVGVVRAEGGDPDLLAGSGASRY